MTDADRNRTHHLVPRRTGGSKDNPSFTPTCLYCHQSRSTLAALHGDEEVTRYLCPQAPR